jgi:phosphatidylglycerophosphatase A
MLARPARLLALGFGSGLSPWAPGTVGTLWAWLVFVVLESVLGPSQWAVILPLAFVAGIVACGATARDLGVADHGGIVWDEIVAFWLVLLVVPSALGWQLAAFLLFRFFDIVKPPPIRYCDRNVKGGFGVMLDDLLAAGYTLLALAVARVASGDAGFFALWTG